MLLLTESDWLWGLEHRLFLCPLVHPCIPAKEGWWWGQCRWDTLSFNPTIKIEKHMPVTLRWFLRIHMTIHYVFNLTLYGYERDYDFNYYPPVSPVLPLLPVVLGCLCYLQLPLTLSVQGAQCPPGHPEMSVIQNGFPSLTDKCMFHIHEVQWRMCNRTITLVSTVWKWKQLDKFTNWHLLTAVPFCPARPSGPLGPTGP